MRLAACLLAVPRFLLLRSFVCVVVCMCVYAYHPCLPSPLYSHPLPSCTNCMACIAFMYCLALPRLPLPSLMGPTIIIISTSGDMHVSSSTHSAALQCMPAWQRNNHKTFSPPTHPSTAVLL